MDKEPTLACSFRWLCSNPTVPGTPLVENRIALALVLLSRIADIIVSTQMRRPNTIEMK